MTIDSTFVRAAFYVEPPTTQDPEEWAKWLAADEAAAVEARKAHTRLLRELGLNQEQLDLSAPTTTRKVGGVWKSSPTVGYVSDGEESGHVEPGVDADQTKELIKAKWAAENCKRGTKSGYKAARRRANAKARK